MDVVIVEIKENINLLKKTFIYLRPYKLKFVITIMCMIGTMLLSTVQPLLFGRIIDLTLLKNLNLIFKTLGFVSIVFILNATLRIIHQYLLTLIASKIEFDIRKEIFNSILMLPTKKFDKTQKGEYFTKIDNDVQVFSSVLTQNSMILIDIGTCLVIGIIIFKLNLVLSLILLGSFPLSFISYNYFGKKLKKKEFKLKKNKDNYYNFIQEALDGFKTIKILNAEKLTGEKYSQILANLYKIGIKRVLINVTSTISSQLINFTSYILVLGLGAYQIFLGNLTLGGLVAFNSYSDRFRNLLLSISQINSKIQQASVSLERIFHLIEQYKAEKQKNINKNAIPENYFKQDIVINNLSFRYSQNSPYILKNINLTIPSNKLTAITGCSGEGKTTIFKLLAGLYDDYEGEILLSDIEYREISREQFYKKVTYVPQETFLLTGTIKENLILANPNATDEDIIKACKMANIHDFIVSLKNGYKTKIGYNGIQLSVGQKQRISIARSLLREAEIFLFDEITSSLDPESEFSIKKMLKSLSRDHTVIIISHRLTTFSEADIVLALKNCKLIVQGKNNLIEAL